MSGYRDTAITPGTAVTVGASSVALVAGAVNYTEVFVCNDHATNVVYLSLGGTAVSGQGIRLGPNMGVVIDSYRGAINAIATGAGTNVTVSVV